MKVDRNMILNAKNSLDTVIKKTQLHQVDVKKQLYVKREDNQVTGAYKIRGAYNCIINSELSRKGVVCASTGNHALGVAYSCKKLERNCEIFMNTGVSEDKIHMIEYTNPDAKLFFTDGEFDDACKEALEYACEEKKLFVHPFDDPYVIAGQGTIGAEIAEAYVDVDTIAIPVGGGGLLTGVATYLKEVNPKIKIIAVESVGSACLHNASLHGLDASLDSTDKFVDAVAVRKPGRYAVDCMDRLVDEFCTVTNEEIVESMIHLFGYYCKAEPAGALAHAGLKKLNKTNALAIVSGGNIEWDRFFGITGKLPIYF